MVLFEKRKKAHTHKMNFKFSPRCKLLLLYIPDGMTILKNKTKKSYRINEYNFLFADSREIIQVFTTFGKYSPNKYVQYI